MTSNKTYQVNIRIDSELKTQLDILASRFRRTLSDYIRIILEDEVSRQLQDNPKSVVIPEAKNTLSIEAIQEAFLSLEKKVESLPEEIESKIIKNNKRETRKKTILALVLLLINGALWYPLLVQKEGFEVMHYVGKTITDNSVNFDLIHNSSGDKNYPHVLVVTIGELKFFRHVKYKNNGIWGSPFELKPSDENGYGELVSFDKTKNNLKCNLLHMMNIRKGDF